ncbi:hypothetical protein ACIG3E_37350 [Streptomyces sp. NPDC053474]
MRVRVCAAWRAASGANGLPLVVGISAANVHFLDLAAALCCYKRLLRLTT